MLSPRLPPTSSSLEDRANTTARNYESISNFHLNQVKRKFGRLLLTHGLYVLLIPRLSQHDCQKI